VYVAIRKMWKRTSGAMGHQHKTAQFSHGGGRPSSASLAASVPALVAGPTPKRTRPRNKCGDDIGCGCRDDIGCGCGDDKRTPATKTHPVIASAEGAKQPSLTATPRIASGRSRMARLLRYARNDVRGRAMHAPIVPACPTTIVPALVAGPTPKRTGPRNKCGDDIGCGCRDGIGCGCGEGRSRTTRLLRYARNDVRGRAMHATLVPALVAGPTPKRTRPRNKCGDGIGCGCGDDIGCGCGGGKKETTRQA
jgi:hypothetical protein